MNVSIIGSGNLAWHLAPALDNTDYPIKEVYSLRRANAEALAGRLYRATVQETLDFSASPSRLFIIAVADDAIGEVVNELTLPPDAMLVHTSGSQPLSVLDNSGALTTGVFYPLQTFSKKRKVDFKEIPVFVESDDRPTERILLSMAGAITKNVHRVSSSQRQALHVAAVFASNFTNHMLAIAEEIAKSHNLDFEWLKPLVAEMVNKSLSVGPRQAQTGPARRGDLEILDRHMAFLKKDEAVAEIYRAISQHIVDRYDQT